MSAVVDNTALTSTTSPGRVQRANASTFLGAAIGALVVAWLVTIGLGDNRNWQTKVTEMCVLVTLASMWNLLAGYSGLVSIGQQAFVGLGGYGLIIASNGWNQDIYFSVLPAALIGLVIGVPIALLAFRLRGGYFAIGMWAIAEVVRLVIKNNTSDTIRGGRGTSLVVKGYEAGARTQTTMFVALFVCLAALAVVYVVLRGRLGLALQAVRDNEAGARGLGADVYRTRLTVFLIAAAFTSAAGAVYYLKNLNIQPDAAFSVGSWTAPIVVMVVIGGLGTVEGPVVGAVGYYLLRDYFTGKSSPIEMSDATFLIVTGLVAVVCSLYLRRGVWGTVQAKFPKLSLFPVRRRLTVEGMQGDRRAI
jgi:branched-chain amino acid transport system permease protein